MINIKSYKDGDRLVLVVENCTGETASKVNQFVSSLLGITELDPVLVPAVQKLEVVEEKLPVLGQDMLIEDNLPFAEPLAKEQVADSTIPYGAYKGYTPEEAITQDGVRAAIILYKTRDTAVTSPYRDNLTEICLDVIRKDILERKMEAELFNKDMLKDFVDVYQLLIQKGVEDIIDKTGYKNIDEMLIYESDNVLASAYMSLLNSVADLTQ